MAAARRLLALDSLAGRNVDHGIDQLFGERGHRLRAAAGARVKGEEGTGERHRAEGRDRQPLQGPVLSGVSHGFQRGRTGGLPRQRGQHGRPRSAVDLTAEIQVRRTAGDGPPRLDNRRIHPAEPPHCQRPVGFGWITSALILAGPARTHYQDMHLRQLQGKSGLASRILPNIAAGPTLPCRFIRQN